MHACLESSRICTYISYPDWSNTEASHICLPDLLRGSSCPEQLLWASASLSQNCPLKGKILLVTEEDGSGLKGLEGTPKDRAQPLWPCLGPGTLSSDGDIPLVPLVPQQPDEVVWSQDKHSAI